MEHTPGALNLGQTTATRIYCGFFIVYFTSPVFIAPLADNHLGQYKTLLISLTVYALGCLALVVSSLPSMLGRGAGLSGLIIAMVLIALGGGGTQAIMRSFIANQYTDRAPREMTLCGTQNHLLQWLRRRVARTCLSKYLPASSKGERVVVDSEITLKFIYNLYFWIGNVGALSAFPCVYIERHHDFAPSYALGLGCIIIALGMLVFGRKCFVNPPQEADVIVPAAKVLSCAVRNGCRMDRADPAYQRLEKSKEVPWSSQFVDELTRALGACRVLLAFIVFYICFDQMQNNLISQASDMDTGSTPNDVLPGMNQVACIIVSPFVEYVLNPMLAKRRIYLKPVTRIAIGFCFVVLSMLHATLVQHYIYASPPCFDHPTDCGDRQSVAQDRPNVWVQAPLYFLIATGEVFAMTTAMEYAEKHAPKEMKVLVQAINMLITGIGSAIALVIAEGARDPYLTRFYGSLAGAMALTTIIFYVVFRNNDNDDIATSPHGSADVEKGNRDATPTPPLTASPFRSRESYLSVPTTIKDEGIELRVIPPCRLRQ
ncbi:uncharacterized protein J4E84_008164 [Alternaria hordeiaustralica]|uniref:uncharacterized protein n=1 Tax=Alternaria hordeiaustralica TaxID=1187925 RepID=UPI0020C34413|nr:uncharacterized protein J4E84_008164 [Alternaria hordeiaustralica]KAI4679642.1 hypothetical protein J4E84_008164 [Alternaria hordeiaustralica]